MGMSAGSRRGITMTRGLLYQIQMIMVVRELDVKEDHCIVGSGYHGCGNRSLYQIQMIVVVMNIEEELDHCI